MAETNATKSASAANGTAAADIDKQAFLKAVDKAGKGDQKALAEVRAMCKAHPALWEMIQVDLAGTVRDTHLKLLTSGNGLTLDAINRDLRKMKRDILGANPSPLEKLLYSAPRSEPI